MPPVSASSENVDVWVHRREVAEEPERGAPVGDLNGTSKVPLFLLLSNFSVMGPVWSVGYISYVTNDVVGLCMRYNLWYYEI